MMGLIATLGVAAYAIHKNNNDKKKTNYNYTIAKYIEHLIEEGKKGTPHIYGDYKIPGDCNINEIIRIMAEDGYNFFDHAKYTPGVYEEDNSVTPGVSKAYGKKPVGLEEGIALEPKEESK